MIRYHAIAPAVNSETKEPSFDGRTCGVKFEAGEVYFDDITIKKRSLGRSAEDIAETMEQDFGYVVERMHENGSPLTDKELAALRKARQQEKMGRSEAVTAPLPTETETEPASAG